MKQEQLDENCAVRRTARKEWACICGEPHEAFVGRRNPNKREDCPGTPIKPGDQYIEYLGESAAWQSGHRYHIECFERAWS